MEKLEYTSRDHCNNCLYSLHVDVNPGDRLNECKGLLKPINVIISSKKQKQIEYRCNKCGKKIKNIVADDDSDNEMYKILEEYSKTGGK